MGGYSPPLGGWSPEFPGTPFSGSFDSGVKPFVFPVTFTFPAGTLRTLWVPGQLASLGARFSPGPGFRWRVLMGRVALTTDANIANRYSRIGLCDSGGDAICPQAYGAVTPASTTNAFSFHEHWSTQTATMNADAAGFAIGQGWIIEGTDYIQLAVSSVQVGDTLSAKIRVLEVRV